MENIEEIVSKRRKLKAEKKKLEKVKTISEEKTKLENKKIEIEKLLEIKNYLLKPDVISDADIISGYDLKHLLDEEKRNYKKLIATFDMKRYPSKDGKNMDEKFKRSVSMEYVDDKLLLNYAYDEQHTASFIRSDSWRDCFYFSGEAEDFSLYTDAFNSFEKKNKKAMQNLYDFAERNPDLFIPSFEDRVEVNDGSFNFSFNDIGHIDGSVCFDFRYGNEDRQYKLFESNRFSKLIRENQELILKKVSVNVNDLDEETQYIYSKKRNPRRKLGNC